MREKMRAGPGCEDLKMRSPYFYSVALGLQPHLYSNDTLAPFVIKSFRDRYQVWTQLRAGCLATFTSSNSATLLLRLSFQQHSPMCRTKSAG